MRWISLDWVHLEENMLTREGDGVILRQLLEATKGQSFIDHSLLSEKTNLTELIDRMATAGLLQSVTDTQVCIPGTTKVQLAIRSIQLGQPERRILNALTWQEFEDFVSTVFSIHNFQVHPRYRFKTIRRYEIDIIATRKPIIFCVDCKHYGIRLGKSSVLRKAAEAQRMRVEELAKHFAANQVELDCLNWLKAHLIPMLVTLLIEEVSFFGHIPLVPAASLNAFLLEYERYFDQLDLISPESGRQTTLDLR